LPRFSARIAKELAVQPQRVTAPFIARHRKDATGGLDDTQWRALEERLRSCRDPLVGESPSRVSPSLPTKDAVQADFGTAPPPCGRFQS
jgi:hypothetical protein